MKQLKENQKNEGLTLVGERIYLRGFEAADAEAIARFPINLRFLNFYQTGSQQKKID